MRYRTFLLFNIIGAFLWAVCITYLGYLLGAQFEAMGLEIDHILLPVIGIILLVSVSPAIVHLIRNPDHAKAIWKGTNKQVMAMFGWDENGDPIKKDKKKK